MPRHECQNCSKEWSDDEIVTPIKDLDQRVAPGELVPSGECPDCGALTHQIKVEHHVEVIPGLSTPEGQRRVAKALDARDQLDYQCYQMLAKMYDEGMLQDGDSDDDTIPKVLRKEIRELVDARVQANHDFIEATAGRGGDANGS